MPDHARDFDITELKSKIGQEIHVSEWVSVSQAETNDFARVTRDLDPNHINPEFARAQGPFGTTVLFGFQILSMLTFLCRPLRAELGSGSLGHELNYGLNRVRFVRPIPVGARFRNRVTLKRIEPRKNGDYLVTTTNTIELEDGEKPAVVAEWLGLITRRSSVGTALTGQ